MSSHLPLLPAPKYQSPLACTSARKSLSMGEMRRPASLSAESIKAVAQLHQEVLVRETQDQHLVQSVPPHFPGSPSPPSSAADSDIVSTWSDVPSTHLTVSSPQSGLYAPRRLCQWLSRQ
ncbi:hypothetical protein B0H16DRAFT_1470240 [Mycena metata]|uniref:Uncharacterized protein n=1 Tax=Mycena metata TaxID=1033252 RepID=A0AAD7HVD5_9AGAR|nr:hypothetical protein B0H16DRAFT_1470240 [Mycena metata]